MVQTPFLCAAPICGSALQSQDRSRFEKPSHLAAIEGKSIAFTCVCEALMSMHDQPSATS